MYKIKNITNGKLIITDLGIKLNSGDTFDLDDFFTRDKIESSTHLEIAKKNELIAILHKDVVTNTPIDPAALLEMETRIKSQISKQIQESMASNDISSKLSTLLDKLSQKDTYINISENIKETTVDECSIDDDKLLDVHMKALKRMTKNVDGQVKAEENNAASNVDSIVNELDNLL